MYNKQLKVKTSIIRIKILFVLIAKILIISCNCFNVLNLTKTEKMIPDTIIDMNADFLQGYAYLHHAHEDNVQL